MKTQQYPLDMRNRGFYVWLISLGEPQRKLAITFWRYYAITYTHTCRDIYDPAKVIDNTHMIISLFGSHSGIWSQHKYDFPLVF